VSLLSSDREASRNISSAILFLKFNTRRFSTNIYRWNTCDAWSHPLRKKQYHFIFPTIASSKRSGKHRKSVLYSMHLVAAVPAYYYIKRCASSRTYRSTRFDLNFKRFRFFTYIITADIIKIYRQILMHPSQTCREFSDATIFLLMSIQTHYRHLRYSFRVILDHQMS